MDYIEPMANNTGIDISLFSNVSAAPIKNNSAAPEPVRTKEFNNLMYIAIVLCIVGSAGNILIIKIMRRKRFKLMPRSLICSTLAVVDLIFLIHYFIGETLVAAGIHIYLMILNFSCRLYLWIAPLSSFLMHVDAWLIVILGCERLLGVVKPLHVHTMVTRKRIKLVISCIIIFFILFDFEMSVRNDYLHLDPCSMDPKLYTGIFHVKYQLTVLLASAVPLAIIIPTNLIIIVYFIRHVKAQEHLGLRSRYSSEAWKVNLMMFSICGAFIILVGPLAVYTLAGGKGGTAIHGICVLLQFLNFVVNVFLYFFSGEIFRQEVMSWVRSLWRCGRLAGRNELSIITRNSTTHNDNAGENHNLL